MNQGRFSEDFVRTKGANSVLQKYGISQKDIWDWSVVQHPDKTEGETGSFQAFVLDYLSWDFEEAKKGR